MSSLHTKYRPEKFEDVLGQDAVIRSLKRVVKDKRAHGFLFVGPAGTGKTTLARILAKTMGCTGSINLLEYDAVSKSTVEDARNLVSSLYYKAIGERPVKFVIVDEAHQLSSKAWDVFLKPLEEPPAHVYYAFCSTVLGKIPKAILTRCLRYDLKPVKEEAILELLCQVADDEKLEISDEIIEAIAEEAGGSPRQALVYLEACAGAPSLSDARQLMRSAEQSKEVIDLARWLVAGKQLNWTGAIKYAKALKDSNEPESVRIVLQNYFAAVLMNTNNDQKAAQLLRLVEAFSKPYLQSDKWAPFMLSLGLALGLDG